MPEPRLPIQTTPQIQALYSRLAGRFQAIHGKPAPGTPEFFRCSNRKRHAISGHFWEFLANHEEFDTAPDGCSWVLDLSSVWTCDFHDILRRYGHRYEISRRDGDLCYWRCKRLHTLRADPVWWRPFTLTRAAYHLIGVRIGSGMESLLGRIKRKRRR